MEAISTPTNGSSYPNGGLYSGQNGQDAGDVIASIAQAQAISAGIHHDLTDRDH